MNVIEVVKEHPIPVVVGVVIILLLMSRGGGASSPGNTAALAVQNNTQIAGINAQTAVSLGAQATERYKAGESAAIARMGVASDIFATATNASAAQATNNSANNLKVVQQTFARAMNLDNLQADSENKQRAINAGLLSQQRNLDAQLAAQKNDINFKLNEFTQTIDANGSALDKQLSFTKDNLPTLLQHAENMLKIGGSNAQALATINGNTTLGVAQYQTDAQRTAADAAANKSNWGIVSDIGSTIAAFFG